MGRNITVYVILTAFFFLLFLVMAVLLEKRKKPIQTFPGKKFPLLMKVNRDTVIKGFATAGFILFSRRLIYYVHFDGIIQTKFSIWWVHGTVMVFVVLFLAGFVILLVISIGIKELKDIISIFSFLLTGTLLSILFTSLPADIGKSPTDPQPLDTIILTPLLLLKMLVSGKYLGILTSFVVGYFIIGNYKKLNPKKYRVNIKFFTALGFIILVFFAFVVLKFPGDWEKRFTGKVQAANSERKVMDLLEAANTIPVENHKDNALKEIAIAAAKIGNIEWAMSITKKLQDNKIKNAAIKEIQKIRHRIEKK